jgi:hypothetical protein
MNVNPANPFDSHHADRIGHRAARRDRATADSADKARTSAARVGPDSAAEKARETAELIRRRQQNGYYHRPEVVRAVVLRLMDSGDLDRIALPDC